MTKMLNFALKIKGGGREGGTCEVLRPCHPPKIWNVHMAYIQCHSLSRMLFLNRLGISAEEGGPVLYSCGYIRPS